MSQVSNNTVTTAIDEIAELASTDIEPTPFYQELIGRLASVLPTTFACAWDDSGDALRVICSTGGKSEALSDGEPRAATWNELLTEVRTAGGVRIFPPGAEAFGRTINPSDEQIILAAAGEAGDGAALIELRLSQDADATTLERTVEVLEIAGELAASYHRHRELSRLRAIGGQWGQREDFSCSVHRSLNLVDVAYVIANDGRRLIGCDRLTVVGKVRGGFHVLAVSGLETVNSRANVIRRLRQLAKLVLPTASPVNYPEDLNSLPARHRDAMLAAIDESHARRLRVVPLMVEPSDDETVNVRNTDPKLVGGLIIEQFNAEPVLDDPIEAVARHSAVAIENAREHCQIFLRPLWSAVGRAGALFQARLFPKTALAILFLVTLVGALIIIPADFTLSAEGTLQAQNRRQVFASESGVVTEMFVRHGDPVEVGSPLLKLRSTELELELEEVTGEFQTTTKKIVSVGASRADADAGELTRSELNRLVAEEEELAVWLESLKEQKGLLQSRRERLLLTSPITGVVVTTDVEELLDGRPVNRGEALLKVADVTGSWGLELHVPDKHVGQLLESGKRADEPLEVEYILATAPETTYRGRIARVARATTPDANETNYGLKVWVDVKEDKLSRLRPGARVVARIHCGKRSLGYVWFHELIAFLSLQSFRLF
ncbi:efflux RND transporter periplasmic adaptor subunit [Stratiformator vulcanicus]|uniref:HlyD family secretion protein n=1 Tax=Stratiformator vulcanicus TaxID=2527980 RepID=A0A517R131_9PLAN|nr:efflux RND transporter periplasmic adaptor subunit [Stratiformator vulcanicus]QDT37581.1 HlyD family secretion protein [Stratiformator vulcanicus]